MKPPMPNRANSESRFAGAVTLITVAFPSWGALLSALYLLLPCGLRLSSVRDLWRAWKPGSSSRSPSPVILLTDPNTAAMDRWTTNY